MTFEETMEYIDKLNEMTDKLIDKTLKEESQSPYNEISLCICGRQPTLIDDGRHLSVVGHRVECQCGRSGPWKDVRDVEGAIFGWNIMLYPFRAEAKHMQNKRSELKKAKLVVEQLTLELGHDTNENI